MEEVAFLLDDDGTGWPPVAIEWLYLEKADEGYRVETTPFFVKDISVGDVINLDKDNQDRVISWVFVKKSRRSTIWISVQGENDIEGVLRYLRSLGCNTETLRLYNYYAIDVPEDVPLSKVDEALSTFDNTVAWVVFPSLRHEEHN